jgi:hypothetical protein
MEDIVQLEQTNFLIWSNMCFFFVQRGVFFAFGLYMVPSDILWQNQRQNQTKIINSFSPQK